MCSPSQMILLILLWHWSNEDLLNLSFHELLMIGLLIQTILLKLEASIPSCVVDTSWSISFQLHTRSCQCTGRVHPSRFSAPLNRCVWTLRYAHHQQQAHPPLNQELYLWNNLHYFLNRLNCWNLASYHRHSDLRTNYKQFGLISAVCPARNFRSRSNQTIRADCKSN